jgi:hypothetical protein
MRNLKWQVIVDFNRQGRWVTVVTSHGYKQLLSTELFQRIVSFFVK